MGIQIYIYKVLKQVHPEVGCSKKAMDVLNSFVTDIFNRICLTEEYYITSTEVALLADNGVDIAKHAGPGVSVIEYGCGSSDKIRSLLDCLDNPAEYWGIDISRDHLLRNADAIGGQRLPQRALQQRKTKGLRRLGLPQTATIFGAGDVPLTIVTLDGIRHRRGQQGPLHSLQCRLIQMLQVLAADTGTGHVMHHHQVIRLALGLDRCQRIDHAVHLFGTARNTLPVWKRHQRWVEPGILRRQAKTQVGIGKGLIQAFKGMRHDRTPGHLPVLLGHIAPDSAPDAGGWHDQRAARRGG